MGGGANVCITFWESDPLQTPACATGIALYVTLFTIGLDSVINASPLQSERGIFSRGVLPPADGG